MSYLLKMIPKSWLPYVKTATTMVDKASPTIFIGAGLLGMGVAVYSAAKNAPKVEEELKEIREDETKDRLDIVKAYAKGYAVPAALFTVSAASIIWGHKITLSRLAALGAAYSLSEKRLKEYADAVRKEVGDKKTDIIEEGFISNDLKNIPSEAANGIVSTGYGDTLFFEPITGRLFRASTNAVDRAVNEINRLINSGINARFSEFEYAMKLPSSEAGKNLEWSTDRLDCNLCIRYVADRFILPNGDTTSVLILKYEDMPKLLDKFYY